jgi:hypothetical protein
MRRDQRGIRQREYNGDRVPAVLDDLRYNLVDRRDWRQVAAIAMTSRTTSAEISLKISFLDRIVDFSAGSGRRGQSTLSRTSRSPYPLPLEEMRIKDLALLDGSL